MKKKLKALYILAVIVLLLSTLTAGLYMESAQDGIGVDEETVYLTDIPVSSVNAVAITNAQAGIGLLFKGENVQLLLSDSSGELLDSEGGRAYDQSQLRYIAYVSCHIPALKRIEKAGKAEEYGFDAPQANISLMLTDGSRVDLLLGNRVPGQDSSYMKNLSGEEVYIVALDTAELFLRAADDFISHSPFPQVSASDCGSVSRIVFRRNGESLTIENKGGSFYLTDPIDQRLRTFNVYSMLIVPAGSIYAEKCIEAGSDITLYGFDSADMEISMTIAEKNYSAYFMTGGEKLLMAVVDTGDVFELDKEILKLLPSGMSDLVGSCPYYYSFGDCTALRAETEDFIVNFELSGSGESISAVCGSRKLSSEETASLAQSVNSVEISERSQVGENASSVLTMYFSLADGSTETVKILSDDNRYYASVNGTVNFSVSQLSVSNLIAGLETYA